MITVHVWKPDGGGVGHASAVVTGGAAGSGKNGYVSWWPSAGHWKLPKPGGRNSYADDVDAEGRSADWIGTLDGLDEALGLNWWRKFHSNPESDYQATTTNCSWAVATFLKECGADSRIGWLSFRRAYNLPSIAPREVFKSPFRFARAMPTVASQMGVPVPIGVNYKHVVSYMDHHSWTWTPYDIIRYANAANGR